MKLAEDMPVIPVYWRHEDYAVSEKLVEGYARKPFQAYNFICTSQTCRLRQKLLLKRRNAAWENPCRFHFKGEMIKRAF